MFLLALMVMVVDERRSTVGTLRLIGFTRRRILIQVLAEGALIATVGAAAGILFAFATQGLFMLNDESVMDAAAATTKRLLADNANAEPVEIVDKLFELVLGAPATNNERDEMLSYIQRSCAELTAQGAEDANVRAWALACQALFASSRFQILE